jgi:hypothetical protein
MKTFLEILKESEEDNSSYYEDNLLGKILDNKHYNDRNNEYYHDTIKINSIKLNKHGEYGTEYVINNKELFLYDWELDKLLKGEPSSKGDEFVI